MDETKLDWDDLRLFLAVARNRGLAAAALETGKSAPTLGRRMLALERSTGRELFRRMPRGYELTDDGETLLADVLALECRVMPLLASDADRLAPVVKISAGHWMTYLLCQRLDELVGGQSVRLRFIAADEVSDIGRREALIGIRNKRPEATGLAGRKIGRIRFAVYAVDESVDIWARVIGNTPSALWVGERAKGGATIEVTSPRNALDLALASKARAVLPVFVGRRFDSLKQMSKTIGELEHEQWLVTHHEDRFLPEARSVIDRMYGILKENCRMH
jgi:DNA-binding transcriptional LysR family regulator